MDMNQAAVFLAGSILTSLGLVVLVIGAVVINNIIDKFWKPVTIFNKDSFTLFGNSHNYSDPMQNITTEEYDKLASYLGKLREKKSTRTEPKMD